MGIDDDINREIKEEWHINLINKSLFFFYFWSMECYKYNEALVTDSD